MDNKVLYVTVCFVSSPPILYSQAGLSIGVLLPMLYKFVRHRLLTRRWKSHVDEEVCSGG